MYTATEFLVCRHVLVTTTWMFRPTRHGKVTMILSKGLFTPIIIEVLH